MMGCGFKPDSQSHEFRAIQIATIFSKHSKMKADTTCTINVSCEDQIMLPSFCVSYSTPAVCSSAEILPLTANNVALFDVAQTKAVFGEPLPSNKSFMLKGNDLKNLKTREEVSPVTTQSSFSIENAFSSRSISSFIPRPKRCNVLPSPRSSVGSLGKRRSDSEDSINVFDSIELPCSKNPRLVRPSPSYPPNFQRPKASAGTGASFSELVGSFFLPISTPQLATSPGASQDDGEEEELDCWRELVPTCDMRDRSLFTDEEVEQAFRCSSLGDESAFSDCDEDSRDSLNPSPPPEELLIFALDL